ncbi:MlaD family protein [Nocardioides nitrophenolicus]|uniref:MlaD family protein n=1 Tax=Nocardioides nitrophenolicus TaxID=60489 RepID=UPI00195870F1|nr:MlaD family protein [Nocardioides nitrophenolicus]MBM7516280.1 phospholipid/cholesterol/gamma-HCH transport system substrate-binding protein [Nocardioides nitrophenolicus]
MQQLTRGVHVKLGLFVVVALLGTSYLGATYAGFTPFSDGYRVTVSLPEAGGLFVHSEVTYRGVQVGKVTAMEPTDAGVEVSAEIRPGAPAIPADATAWVRNRSSIGEQYLDLEGATSTHLLADGDHLAAGRDALPPDLSEVLRSGRDLVASIPSEALNTVIDETYLLAQGTSEDFGRLLRTSQDFQKAADDNFLASASLIRNSDRVLATQEDASTAIGAYSADLARFAQALAGSDSQLRTLIAATPGAARELSLLLRDVGQPLSNLMDNLVSTATVFGANATGMRDALIRFPEAVSIGWATTSARGINLGMVPTFFNPLPCTTGYAGTALRRGTDASDGPPLNRRAGCTAPRGEGNVRGPQAVAGGADGGAAPRPADVVEDLDDLLGGR